MIDENLKFEKRHVLYCDLLGFSKYLQSEFFEPSRCFRLFSQLDQMLVDAKVEIDASVPDVPSGLPPDYVVKPEAIYCSDSIVISTPATNVDAIWLCEAAARIQNGICAHGFLLRGAIVTGQLYHSGNTIFGPAIAKAVAMDKSGAPPVVVVDKETLDFFTYANTDEEREIVKIREHQLIASEDSDQPHIDPFWQAKTHTIQESIHPSTRQTIEIWRTLIETGLKNEKPEVLGKYVWMAKMFNRSLCNKASAIKPIGLHEEDGLNVE